MTPDIAPLRTDWTKAVGSPLPRAQAHPAPPAETTLPEATWREETAAEATPPAASRTLDYFDPNTLPDQATQIALWAAARGGLVDPPGNRSESEEKAGEEDDPVIAALKDALLNPSLTPDQWDRVKILVGDTWTTQGELLAARKQYLANFDEYYDQAVREGNARAEEKDIARKLLEVQIRKQAYEKTHGGKNSNALDAEEVRLRARISSQTQQTVDLQPIQAIREKSTMDAFSRNATVSPPIERSYAEMREQPPETLPSGEPQSTNSATFNKTAASKKLDADDTKPLHGAHTASTATTSTPQAPVNADPSWGFLPNPSKRWNKRLFGWSDHGIIRSPEVAIHADLGETVIAHEGFNQGALSTPVPQFTPLRTRQFFLPAEVNAPRVGFLNPLPLPFRTELGLKLGNRPQHVKE